MRLSQQQAPLAVENFAGHARSGYFGGVVFHHVILKFMIQTGDPSETVPGARAFGEKSLKMSQRRSEAL